MNCKIFTRMKRNASSGSSPSRVLRSYGGVILFRTRCHTSSTNCDDRPVAMRHASRRLKCGCKCQSTSSSHVGLAMVPARHSRFCLSCFLRCEEAETRGSFSDAAAAGVQMQNRKCRLCNRLCNPVLCQAFGDDSGKTLRIWFLKCPFWHPFFIRDISTTWRSHMPRNGNNPFAAAMQQVTAQMTAQMMQQMMGSGGAQPNCGDRCVRVFCLCM